MKGLIKFILVLLMFVAGSIGLAMAFFEYVLPRLFG